jgi:hypothetical protein
LRFLGVHEVRASSLVRCFQDTASGARKNSPAAPTARKSPESEKPEDTVTCPTAHCRHRSRARPTSTGRQTPPELVYPGERGTKPRSAPVTPRALRRANWPSSYSPLIGLSISRHSKSVILRPRAQPRSGLSTMHELPRTMVFSETRSLKMPPLPTLSNITNWLRENSTGNALSPSRRRGPKPERVSTRM